LSGQRFDEPFLSFCAHTSLSYAHTVHQRFDLTMPHGIRTLADYRPQCEANSRLSTAKHSVRRWAFSSVSDTACGRLDQAIDRALAGAREGESGRSQDIMFATNWLGFLYVLRGDLVQGKSAYQRSIRLARQIGSNMFVAVGLRVMATLDMVLLGPEKGLAHWTDCEATAREAFADAGAGMFDSWAIESLLQAGAAHLAVPFLERMRASDDWDENHPSDLWLEAAVLVSSKQDRVRGQALLEQTVDLSRDKGTSNWNCAPPPCWHHCSAPAATQHGRNTC
jgi:hypothetical protein